MEPRARVSVWPGRRCVPGIVAPDPRGARGAECLPRDVLRPTPPVISTCDSTTARRCLCLRTGSGTTEARPPESSAPPATNGGWGCYRATRPIPGRILGAEASPRVAHADRRCAGVCSLTRGNLTARHADCARLVDESGKKGWQKLDGPQRGQVHPGLIWQDTIRAGPSSSERTWASLIL